MPTGIVYIFELIQIEKKQGAGMLVAGGQVQHLLQFFLKAAPVEKVGKWIMVGEPGQASLCALVFGHVETYRQYRGIILGMPREAGMQPENIPYRCILAHDIGFMTQLVPSLGTHFPQMARKVVQVSIKRKKIDEGFCLKFFFRILNKHFPMGIERENFAVSVLCYYDQVRS